MPNCIARRSGFVPSRTGRSVGLVALLLVFSSLNPASAADTRTLSLHNIHTHENLTITYKKNGSFDEDALKKLNAFMRDWRQEQEVRMDPQLYDMLWEVHREVKATGPIHLVCGYRSPTTNAMLRSRSNGVAQTSLHMQGKAVDFSIPSADVAQVRAAALRIQGGGVGYYPTSGIPFVHMDVGSVRHWPRMTRDQLAKVFPDGRTLHIPTDGSPMPGHALAAADAERGVTRQTEERPRRSLLAALFGGTQDAEESADNTAPTTRAVTTRRPAPSAPAQSTPTATAEPAPVPLPPVRPMFQIASAPERQAPASPPRPFNLASLSPNQIITARGYWQGMPDTAPEATQTGISTSQRIASADPDATASLGAPARPDRVPTNLALAYAAQSDPVAFAGSPLGTIGQRPTTSAITTADGSAPVASKVTSDVRAVNNAERLNDPWLRGVVMAPRLENSMTTTTFGAPDFRALKPFLYKPASAVMMTFNGDPYLGMTTETFSGSSVVFQATVTFGARSAMLRQ